MFVLLAGVFIMLVVIVLLLYRLQDALTVAEGARSRIRSGPGGPDVTLPVYLALALFGGLLLIFFLFASYSLVRNSRRLRDLSTRHTRTFTEYVDAWALHKLPEEANTDSSNEGPKGTSDEPPLEDDS